MKVNEAVIIESERQEVVPASHTFVESGDQFLTRTIKRLSAEMGATVFIQKNYNGRFTQTEGYHVLETIAEQAQSLANSTQTSRAGRRQKDEARRYRQGLEEFKETIRKRYPGMPEEFVIECAEHAFTPGRVGQSVHRDLNDKVDLAVGAHARHVHTTYESELQDANHSSDQEYRELKRRIKREVARILKKWAEPNSSIIDEHAVEVSNVST